MPALISSRTDPRPDRYVYLRRRGDSVVCSGKVTRRYEDEGERKVDVELLCTRLASGGAAIKGEATFVVT